MPGSSLFVPPPGQIRIRITQNEQSCFLYIFYTFVRTNRSQHDETQIAGHSPAATCTARQHCRTGTNDTGRTADANDTIDATGSGRTGTTGSRRQ